MHDGAVHIESNDIIQYLEKTFPTPKLIPAGYENEVAALLKYEDDLHLDLRTLSFRFVFAPPGPPKPAKSLKSYALNGSGTVRGSKDRNREIQIEFWERAAREGFTDERSRASAQKFRAEFEELDKRLAKHPYLMGDTLSVLDIAWFIYAHRFRSPGIRSRGCMRASRYGSTGFERVQSSQGKSRCRRNLSPALRLCTARRRRQERRSKW